MAVFNEDVVRHYQEHLERRRGARPDDEYRNVTEQEWGEFEEHFDRRKVELGGCMRRSSRHVSGLAEPNRSHSIGHGEDELCRPWCDTSHIVESALRVTFGLMEYCHNVQSVCGAPSSFKE